MNQKCSDATKVDIAPPPAERASPVNAVGELEVREPIDFCALLNSDNSNPLLPL